MTKVDPLAALAEILWADISETGEVFNTKPLLAHYTSMETLEKIVATEEVWFANPLLMNDLQELRFGMNQGRWLFTNSDGLENACESEDRFRSVVNSFEELYAHFDSSEAFDTYVFCLSEHKVDDNDGLLSMWRGYGGNGCGAAIVFDTAKLNPVDDSPLIVSKVTYASTAEREQWIIDKIGELANFISETKLSDALLSNAVWYFFERLKIFALFAKHHGFKEEQEWRAVYLPSRDKKGYFKSMLDYSIGKSGVVPRLKLKIAPIPGLFADDLCIEKLVCKVLLGPGVASVISLHATRRMLIKHNKPVLAEKVVASSTPFRAI